MKDHLLSCVSSSCDMKNKYHTAANFILGFYASLKKYILSGDEVKVFLVFFPAAIREKKLALSDKTRLFFFISVYVMF